MENEKIGDTKMVKDTRKEMIDKHYGYKYTENEDGTIDVKVGEIHKVLDKQPIMVMGNYPNNDDETYTEHIYTDLETLLENVVIGMIDPFGRKQRVGLDRVKNIIENIYYKNGWEDIISYRQVENK